MGIVGAESHSDPMRSAGRVVVYIALVVVGLFIGAFVGLVVGLSTGLIPFVC
jgi:hypothetical protein